MSSRDCGRRTINAERTKYKYVRKLTVVGRNIEDIEGKTIYQAKLAPSKIKQEYSWCKSFDTLREAAIAVDKKLIDCGQQPVNILKAKTKQ